MIAIDIDGVLANFDKSYIQTFNLLGVKVPENAEALSWDHWENELGREFIGKVWDTIKKSYNWWMTLEPYQRNIDALKRFSTAHPEEDILFLTSRIETAGFSAALQTEGWLRKLGIDSPFMTVRTCRAKEKAQVLASENVTHFIDDKGSTVEACEKIPGMTAVLYSRPWNKDAKVFLRLNSLGQFFQVVERDLEKRK